MSEAKVESSPKQSAKKTKSDYNTQMNEWSQNVCAATDVIAEFSKVLTIPKDARPVDGWISVHAYGRPDTTPSARIYVGDGPQRGYYKDFGGTGESHTFYNAMAAFGHFKDWKEAREHYAKLAGIDPPTKTKNKNPIDEVELLPRVDVDTRAAFFFARKYGRGEYSKECFAEAMTRIGFREGHWDKYKEGGSRQHVWAIPFWTSANTANKPSSYVLMNANGHPLRVFVDGKWIDRDKHNIGKTGLMNAFALSNIKEAEVVIWVEGITDCLRTEMMIPESLRGKHVVISSMCGASEHIQGWMKQLLTGKRVIVVGDRDKAGENGAAKRVAAFLEFASYVQNVELPFPYSETKGKDLRDYWDGLTWNEKTKQYEQGPPRTYADFMALAEQSPKYDKPEDAPEFVSSDEEILEQIGIDVLGEHEDHSIVVFVRSTRKRDRIKDINRFTMLSLIQMCGAEIEDKVAETQKDEDGNRHSFISVCKAIGAAASKRRIHNLSILGQGVWPTGKPGEAVVVAGNSALVVRDGKSERLTSPFYNNRVLGLDCVEPWCDIDVLADYIEKANDLGFRQDALNEAINLFDQFHWAGYTYPVLVTGLVMATFVQTTLDWRPQVGIQGQSDCGKSTLMEMLKGIFPLRVAGEKPTEAGVRQAIQDTACAFLLDEVEASWQRGKLWELIRTSSRGDSGVLRGTADQKGKKFSLQHVCWIAAIELGLKRSPDRNRFIILEMKGVPQKQLGTLKKPSVSKLADLGLRLLAITLRHLPEIHEEIEKLKSDSYPGVPSRAVESYAVPVAMVNVALGLTDTKRMKSIIDLVDTSDAAETDEDDLLDTIENVIIRAGHDEASVREILFAVAPKDHLRVALERRGIKRTTRKDGKAVVFIYPKSAAELLTETNYKDQSIATILSRVPGADKMVCKLDGGNKKGISIPLEAFQRIDSSEINEGEVW